MRLEPTLLSLLVLASALLFATRANAIYDAVELPSLDPGSTRVVRAVNDFGEAAGGTQLGHRPTGFIINRGHQVEVVTGLPNSDFTVVLSLNNNGAVVGTSNNASGLHAFRLTRGGATVDLGALAGDANSVAFAVNNGGLIAGYSSGPSGIRAVAWDANGRIAALPSLTASASSRGYGINEPGDVVGVAEIGGKSHAVHWSKTSAQDLGALPGDTMAEALAINNSGQIVGSSGDPAVLRHAVLWPKKGAIQDLGALPGGTSSRALGISEKGVIVGTSESSSGTRAFIWTSTDGMKDLNDQLTARGGFVLTQAVAIAPQGLILAIGQDDVPSTGHAADGHEHDQHELEMRIFLLTPQP